MSGYGPAPDHGDTTGVGGFLLGISGLTAGNWLEWRDSAGHTHAGILIARSAFFARVVSIPDEPAPVAEAAEITIPISYIVGYMP